MVGDQAHVRERSRIGAGAVVGRGSQVDNDVTVGAGCRIQTGCYVTANSVLEDDVFLGPGVFTYNDNTMARHAPDHPIVGPTIRRAARIGGGVRILPGIEIGEEAFVATGAVVTRDVPARAARDGRARAQGGRGGRRGADRAVVLRRRAASASRPSSARRSRSGSPHTP